MTTGTFDRNSAMKGLGQFVRNRRRELGLTQTQLGTRVGYAQERISSVEGGTYGLPSLPSMHELAAALEVPAEHLLAAAGSTSPVSAPLRESAARDRPAHRPESYVRLKAEYDAVCRRFLAAEELANEMMRLHFQLAQRRAALRKLTASCAQIAR